MSPPPRVTVVGLGPAGPELITAETSSLLNGGSPVYLRTLLHPAAEDIAFAEAFDSLYETLDSFDEIYRTIVDRLVSSAHEAGEIIYAVPGSPSVAERTVELLRADGRVLVDVRAAMSFIDLCWAALEIDPMTHAVTIVDAHRIMIDTAGRVGPFLVTQVHSADVLSDVIVALDDATPGAVTVLKGLGTPREHVATVPWGELARSVDPDHLTSLWIPRVEEPVASAFVWLDEMVRTLRAEDAHYVEMTQESLGDRIPTETRAVLAAIDLLAFDPESGFEDLEERLENLLLQVILHARLAAEAGYFTLADVAQGVYDRLSGRNNAHQRQATN